MTKSFILTNDDGTQEYSQTFRYVNPEATEAEIYNAAVAINALTNRSFVKVELVTQKQLDPA